MSRIIVAVLRAVFVVAVLAVGAVWWMGCDGDNGANTGGGSSGSYDYVELGGLKWMKKNLNVSTGDSWCYDNNSSNCNTYGRLYTWEAAKSACQSVGWRLPTNDEWGALVSAASGSSALKSKSGWNNNGNGTDSYGFSAIPGGYRYSVGDFDYADDFGFWWTATEDESGYAYYRYMYYRDDYVNEDYNDKSEGFSARCVKD